MHTRSVLDSSRWIRSLEKWVRGLTVTPPGESRYTGSQFPETHGYLTDGRSEADRDRVGNRFKRFCVEDMY